MQVMSSERSDTKERLGLGIEIVNFIGPEGAGKSYIAKRLASEAGKVLLPVGDTLRELAREDKTYLGDECRAMFNEHRYLDPNMLLEILVQLFKREDLASGCVMDGGLRTVTEATGFPDVLKRSGREMPVTVVQLMVPQAVCVERLIGEDGRKRPDDTPEGVANRLRNFYHLLDERVEVIAQNHELLNVDVDCSKENAFERVCTALVGRKAGR